MDYTISKCDSFLTIMVVFGYLGWSIQSFQLVSVKVFSWCGAIMFVCLHQGFFIFLLFWVTMVSDLLADLSTGFEPTAHTYSNQHELNLKPLIF